MNERTNQPHLQLVIESRHHQDDLAEAARPSFLARRAMAAALIGGALLGGGYVVHEGVKSVKHQLHVNREYDMFSTPDIGSKLTENGIDPSTVFHPKVQHGEATPLDVARDLHAKDVVALADTIAAQVGGAGNLHEGDQLTIPRDLIEPQPPRK